MAPWSNLLVLSGCMLAVACGAPSRVLAADKPRVQLPISKPESQGMSPERLERLHAFMQSEIDSADYLGAVTLIARNGKIVDWRAYGSRDLARTAAMDRDAIFRIYSMTKTMASVAALILMEEGRFAVEDPVLRYLPEFANAQVFAGGTAAAPQLRPAVRPITIRHVLTHTAGFAVNAKENEPATSLLRGAHLDDAPDLATYIARLAAVPLANDPGERFNYDGVATETLSRLIEVVSGEPFDRFLERRVLAPLRLRDTSFSVRASERHRIAELTTSDAKGQLVPATGGNAPGEMLKAYPSGAGGLYSTAADYVRFCQMLLDGGTLDGVSILSRKSVDLMMMNHLSQPAPPDQLREGEGFGLGGYVVLDVGRRGRLGSAGQFGWSGVGSTYYTIDREERLIAILLMQHLPQGLPRDPPKISARFYNLVYQSLR
jgi:CubicO group peptidase (beta-lactamase class C family)